MCCNTVKRGTIYGADSFDVDNIRGQKVLFVPLSEVVTEYVDNTRSSPRREFADTFLTEAANGLALYELSQTFSMVNLTDTLYDSIKSLCSFRYSRIDSSNIGLADAAVRIRNAARLASVAYVVLPYACRLRHSIMKPAGWRNDKYESGHYERPTTHLSKALFHVQLWSSTGELVYERAARAVTRQPFLYSVFKQERADSNIAEFSRKFFAPPMVRALAKAVHESLQLR